MSGAYITKGSFIKAVWFEANPSASIAGMQPKVGATMQVVVGTVRHIRGDHPTRPTSVRLWVEPEGGGDEVIVNPAHVVEHQAP